MAALLVIEAPLGAGVTAGGAVGLVSWRSIFGLPEWTNDALLYC